MKALLLIVLLSTTVQAGDRFPRLKAWLKGKPIQVELPKVNPPKVVVAPELVYKTMPSCANGVCTK